MDGGESGEASDVCEESGSGGQAEKGRREAALLIEAELVRAPGEKQVEELARRIGLGMNFGDEGIKAGGERGRKCAEDIEFGAFGVNFAEADAGEGEVCEEAFESAAGNSHGGGDGEACFGSETRKDGAHAAAEVGGDEQLRVSIAVGNGPGERGDQAGEAVAADIFDEADEAFGVGLEGEDAGAEVRGVAGEESLVGADIEDDVAGANGDARDVVFAAIPGAGEHVERADGAEAANAGAAVADFHDVTGAGKGAMEEDAQGIGEMFDALEGAD